MRQDTAPQLAILFDGTRAHAVYSYLSTEPVSRRLAASAGNCTSAFPRCAGQLAAVKEGQRYAGSGREQQGGANVYANR